MPSIDPMAWYFGDYYYPESADTLKCISKDILYVLLKNYAVIKMKVNENDRMATK
jgi:hypothetical protein